MKTITIYNLLRLVKDGEPPKKIKYNGKIYDYDYDNDDYFNGYYSLFETYNVLAILNMEVEILEEMKLSDDIRELVTKLMIALGDENDNN